MTRRLLGRQSLLAAPLMAWMLCAQGGRAQAAAAAVKAEGSSAIDPEPSVPSYKSVSVHASNGAILGGGLRLSDVALESVNTTLLDLIEFAYDLQAKQILSPPEWADTAKFDLILELPGKDLPNDAQCKRMVREALGEKFGLTAHRIEREMPIYRLVVAPGGPKMASSLGNPNGLPGLHFSRPGAFEARNATMGDFAGALQRTAMSHPVVDATALSQRWDFTLTWTPDETQFEHRDGVPAVSGKPPLAAALESQLGLQLQTATASPGALLIDHVTRPAPH